MGQFELDHFHDPKYFKELGVEFDHEGGVIWLHMMPRGRGCFTQGLLRELKRYQQGLMKWRGNYISDRDLYPVKYEVLTSDLDGVFNYGGDLELLLYAINRNDHESLLKYGISCIDVVYPNAINYELPITTISLVCGDALGGGLEAALSGSIIIAERGVQLGFPEILFGLFPGMGAYSLLARRVSPSLAKKIITDGKLYTAEEFFDMGIVDHLAEKGGGIAAAKSIINKHDRHHNGYCAIDRVINLEQSIDYNDMYKVVEIWVDAAMNLSKKELRVMERLSKAQLRKQVDVRKEGNNVNEA
jgi:DSF synthase